MTQTIYLDRNESQYPPSPNCLQKLKDIKIEHLTQYSRDYQRGVKSRISETLAQELNVPEQQIILSNGAEDLLKMCIHRYLKQGQNLLVPDLSWWYYKEVANEVGGITHTFEINREENKFTYDIAKIIADYNKLKPKIILLTSPNNPTGHSIDIDQLKELLNHCPDPIFILDEAYWGFYSSDSSYISELINKYPKLFVIRSFSKFYALAGLRVGYGIGSRYFEDFSQFANKYLGYNRISEELVLAALADKPYYQDLAKKYHADKEQFLSAFKNSSLIKCYKTDTNFLLIQFDKNIVASVKTNLKQAGFIIKFFNESSLENHARISLGTTEQNLKVLTILKQTAANYSKETVCNEELSA